MDGDGGGGIGEGEGEDAAEEGEFGFEGEADVFGFAESVLLAWEGDAGDGDAVGAEDGDEFFGLVRGDDFVFEALEEDDWAGDGVGVVEG